MHYLITIFNTKTNKIEAKLYKNLTLEQALATAAKKGQIIEVWSTTVKGDPLEEVSWQHLYHF